MIRRGGLTPSDLERVDRLSRALRHRGPDDLGASRAGGVVIGMRRLAIIDPRHGRQPLWNEDRTICVVANGEIYNFVELRRDLEARGHRFATGSDCETIVHLYEDLGDDCLGRLRGMFAFALHDRRNGRVLLARDRLGEKPLYIVEHEGQLTFASELGALVRSGALAFELDPCAVRDYLLWGFVPEPRSAVSGARKLPAGCKLTVETDRWSVDESRWWSLLEAPPVYEPPADAIGKVLDETAELVIRSDVPVGVALSGGVDSSLVAAMARRRGPSVQAFTVGYPGTDRHDEWPQAAETAAQLGIHNHHRIEVATSDAVSLFPAACAARDEPNADISGPGYLAIMRAARDRGVPVLLMGQGGDELFWGYPWTLGAIRATERKARLLRGEADLTDYLRLSRPPASYTGAIDWALGGCGLLEGARALQRDRRTDPRRIVFWDHRPLWSAAERASRRSLCADVLHHCGEGDAAQVFTGPHLWTRPDLSITNLLVSTYLLSNGINQADRLSMSASVECRLPLIDFRLAEVVVGLRKATPDWGLGGKHWLMQAAKSRVPRDVLARRKRGFTPPWRDWTKAIFRAHGERLAAGHLVRSGILTSRSAARLARRPIDFMGRPDPIAMPLLMLESWTSSLLD